MLQSCFQANNEMQTMFTPINTLKDFKNAKIEIHKINNFIMYQFYWDLTTININMSKKNMI